MNRQLWQRLAQRREQTLLANEEHYAQVRHAKVLWVLVLSRSNADIEGKSTSTTSQPINLSSEKILSHIWA